VLLAAVCLVRSSDAQIDGAVYPNNERLREVFASARHRRIALVGIGDSNQLYASDGWEYAWSQALLDRYSLWGTALLSAGENFGTGSSVGTGAATQPAAPYHNTDFQFWTAPPEAVALMGDHPALAPAGYLYIPPDAESPSTSTPHGMVITFVSGLDLSARLRFHFTHALMPGGRELHAFVSQGNWGDPVLMTQAFSTADDGQTHSGRGSGGHGEEIVPAPPVTDSIELPPAPRWWNLRLWFGDEVARTRGPFFLMYMQAENPDNQRGAAVHTLFGLGGASARGMAFSLAQASDAQLSLYFQRVREPLGPNPKVIIRINSGVNDRSEWLPSFASFVLPGNSPEAFRDNIDAVLTRVRAVWTLNNWDADAELSFVISVSHPIDTPDDPDLERYRASLRGLADRAPDVTLVDLSRLACADELLARGWYQSPTDRFHLNRFGHLAVARRELLALVRRPCFEPADLDNNGAVATRDLVMFLQDFGTPALTPGWGGDFDADGDCDTADLVLFLGNFGALTCNAE